MILRPLAVSVVLAAALVGVSVLSDRGASGVPDESAADQAIAGVDGSSPPASPSATASEAPSVAIAPSPGVAGDPIASPSPGASLLPTEEAVVAADRFRTWNRGPRTRKLVALTLDDGWNGRNLRKIMVILEAKRAPATFFPVARAVQRSPATWRGIAAAGFPIGNHSWNHDDLSKGRASAARRDIEKATRAIERVTGVPLFPAIRPPFGASDASFRTAARAAGMQAVILWDVDTRDWTGIGATKVRKAALKAKPGSIVVLHTDKANTVKALPGIIDGLRARGFTLVTVGQLIGLPGPIPTFMERSVWSAERGP